MLAAAGLGLGGCVYYPVRTGVVYDGANGNAVVDYDDSRVDYYAPAPAYYGYYDPYWYGPGWYGSGWYGYGPSISLGFYGGYWGGHHYRGPWRSGHSGYWGGRGGSAHVTAPMGHGTRH
ncbi:hypothetical protein [Rudaea sp.]|uniref:hypothetical protein n=1 Tax=Rudaea sp. TaxID=2136325 RepID=UPI002ED0E549